MIYRIDAYDKEMMCWRSTGLSFTNKNEAIGIMDKMFFSKESKSYRVISEEQKVISQRLKAGAVEHDNSLA